MNFSTMSEQEADYNTRRRAGQLAEVRAFEAHQRDVSASQWRATLVAAVACGLTGAWRQSPSVFPPDFNAQLAAEFVVDGFILR